ncbi:class I SAM-dependent methyltransferase [Natroniella acetigena]|uniref:class I SAM-dependent methyltransferase n=1 Tax=Natroniella acetigena TaxID=52004 RepID=UPI00200B4404|nr:class I SAM-dependent methyltransferase [Natroniella acetigena]MCK8827170.1 class I SAM-dependent methyltransferase [Natroniella acetigena]
MSIQQEIESYWETRADVYSQSIQEELNSSKKEIWKELIGKHITKSEGVKALDLGCGPGFFSILMSELDYEVTAVDCTLDMLQEARNNIENEDFSAQFLKGDVHNLPFLDNSFDLIVCRNLVWNLPEPKQAYQEWYRVLKEGGKLLVFDANWYLRLHDTSLKEEHKKAIKQAKKRGYRDGVTKKQKDKCAQIAEELPLSYQLRPKWDEQVLGECGFEDIVFDLEVSDKVWDEKKQVRYGTTPLFSVCARR